MNHDEREWQAQEEALRDERLGLGRPTADARAVAYRRIAQALRMPPPVALPADFAAELARRVAAPRVDMRLEHWLVGVLVAVFGIAAGIVAWLYGGDWLGTSAAFAPQLANGTTLKWVLAVIGCLAVASIGRPARGDSSRRR